MHTYYILYNGIISQNGWIRDIEITHVTKDIHAAVNARVNELQRVLHKTPEECSSPFEYTNYLGGMHPSIWLQSGLVINQTIYLMDYVTSNEEIDFSDIDNRPIIMIMAKNIKYYGDAGIYTSVDECIEKFMYLYYKPLTATEDFPVGPKEQLENHIRESMKKRIPYGIRRAVIGEVLITNNYTVVPPLPKTAFQKLEDDLK